MGGSLSAADGAAGVPELAVFTQQSENFLQLLRTLCGAQDEAQQGADEDAGDSTPPKEGHCDQVRVCTCVCAI